MGRLVGRTSLVAIWLGLVAHAQAEINVDRVETGHAGQCYDISTNTIEEVYTSDDVIRNLRLLGLEPVTAHGASPSAIGDDTNAIQDAVFAAMEDCVNARGLDSNGQPLAMHQGVPSGADPKFYIDGCRAVFFPPGEYEISDTIRIMQPLQPKSGQLDLSLSNGKVLYDTTTANDPTDEPDFDDHLKESGSGIGVSLRRKSNVLIGSTCPWESGGQTMRRPVIVALPGYFQQEMPMLQFWAQCRNGGTACDPAGVDTTIPVGVTDPTKGQSSVNYNTIFRNIDVDSNVGQTDGQGNRNTGAIAISFPGAQGSAIEDTTITLKDGSGNHSQTGIRNIPGQSGGIYNVRIDGGQFGVDMDRETRFGMAVGLRLFDQQNRAVLHLANNKFVVVGFHIIRNATGPAIRVNNLSNDGSFSGLAMVDGVIKNTGNAVIDVVNRPVYLKNVLIGDAGSHMATTGVTGMELNENNSDPWQEVQEWAYVSNDAESGTPEAMVNGSVTSHSTNGMEMVEVVVPASDPGTKTQVRQAFVDPHLWKWDDLPSFEDSTSTIVLAKTYSDVSATNLNSLLSSSPRIFLGGGGRHPIDATITLNEGEAIAGLDRVHTVIESEAKATDRDMAEWCATAPMVKGANLSANDAMFGRVSLAEHKKCAKFTPVDWRAGEASRIHGVIVTQNDSSGSVDYTPYSDQAAFKFSLNGGGKHWGLQPEGALIEYSTDDPSYRHLLITGTNNDLDIYGFNCEKVSGGAYACELYESSNVNLFNVKAETCQKQCKFDDENRPAPFHGTTSKSILRLRAVMNSSVIGYGGNARPSEGQRAAIILDNAATSDVTLALVNPNTDEATPEITSIASNWFTVRENFEMNGKIFGPLIGGYIRVD